MRRDYVYNMYWDDARVRRVEAEAKSNAEIADKIFLSKRTVEGVRQQLIDKTNTKNTADLVRFAFQKSLIQ